MAEVLAALIGLAVSSLTVPLSGRAGGRLADRLAIAVSRLTGTAPKPAPDPVQLRKERIARLTRSLEESADLLSELERDIAAGEARAEQLRDQIERDSRLAELTNSQAEAMRQVLADVVTARDRRSFWLQFAINLLLFVAGVVVTLLVR